MLSVFICLGTQRHTHPWAGEILCWIQGSFADQRGEVFAPVVHGSCAAAGPKAGESTTQIVATLELIRPL